MRAAARKGEIRMQFLITLMVASFLKEILEKSLGLARAVRDTQVGT